MTENAEVSDIAFNPRFRWITMIGTLGLAINFILFNTSLEYINPFGFASARTGVAIYYDACRCVDFKEKLSWNQKVGALLLFIGLLTFFNARLVELFTSLTTYTKGLLSAFLRQLFGYLMRFLHKITVTPF